MWLGRSGNAPRTGESVIDLQQSGHWVHSARSEHSHWKPDDRSSSIPIALHQGQGLPGTTGRYPSYKCAAKHRLSGFGMRLALRWQLAERIARRFTTAA